MYQTWGRSPSAPLAPHDTQQYWPIVVDEAAAVAAALDDPPDSISQQSAPPRAPESVPHASFSLGKKAVAMHAAATSRAITALEAASSLAMPPYARPRPLPQESQRVAAQPHAAPSPAAAPKHISHNNAPPRAQAPVQSSRSPEPVPPPLVVVVSGVVEETERPKELSPSPETTLVVAPQKRRYTKLRDPLFALIFFVMLSYLAYLTHVGVKRGHAEYVFELARTLASEHVRRAIFEFPLVRAFVANLGGALSLVASLYALPLAIATVVCMRVAGRAVVLGACALGALAACVAAFWGAGVLFEVDAVPVAMLCVVAAFGALVLLYFVYVLAPSLVELGARLERTSGIVIRALPSLLFVSLVVTLLHSLFLAWWALTVAALVTTRVVEEPVAPLESSSYESYYAANGTAISGGSGDEFVYVGGSETAVYYCVFLFLLVSNVVMGILRVAVAGGVGAAKRGHSPNGGVLAAWLRASTLSLGSVVAASLLLTFVETLHFVLLRMKKLAKRTGLSFLLGIAQIAVEVARWLVKFVNSFALVEVALTQKSFFRASRRVYERTFRRTGTILFSYQAAALVMLAFRLLVATLSLALALLTMARPLSDMATRQAILPFLASYGVAALPTLWIEAGLHALLVIEIDEDN